MSSHDLRIRFCRNYPLFSEPPHMEQFFAQLPCCRFQLEHITHTKSLTLNSCFRHPYICRFFILVIACFDSLSYELIWCVILILWHRHLLFPAVDRHKIQSISRIESMAIWNWLFWVDLLCELFYANLTCGRIESLFLGMPFTKLLNKLLKMRFTACVCPSVRWLVCAI